MSWVDVVAAGLGAAGQSIGNQEQINRERKRQALADWEMQQRAEAQEFEQIRAGINPGQPVDPAMLPKAIKYGLKSRIKLGADGQPVWADTLEDTAKRQDITRLSTLTREAEVKATIAADTLAARKMIMDNPEGFFNNPYEKQAVLWKAAEFGGEAPRSMEDLIKLKLADDATAIRVAQIRSGQQNQPRPLNALQQAQLQQRQMELAFEAAGGYEPVKGMKKFTKPNGEQEYNEAVARILAGQQQGAPQGAAPSSGPAVGARRTINGQPAVWDGTGWVAQ